MINTDVMFSSKDQTWETPIDFFKRVDDEFNFTLDVCAANETAKCDNYYTVEDDALTKDWVGTCWCNPPYGREIGNWVKKACAESVKNKNIVVMLIPARTDTSYWHEYIFHNAKEIRFIRGRLKFGNSNNSAPFPSALVIFDGRDMSADLYQEIGMATITTMNANKS